MDGWARTFLRWPDLLNHLAIIYVQQIEIVGTGLLVPENGAQKTSLTCHSHGCRTRPSRITLRSQGRRTADARNGTQLSTVPNKYEGAFIAALGRQITLPIATVQGCYNLRGLLRISTNINIYVDTKHSLIWHKAPVLDGLPDRDGIT